MNITTVLKARVSNIQEILSKLKDITKTEGHVTQTLDHYYTVHNGRMKIRTYEDGSADLVFYNKIEPGAEGTQLDECMSCPVSSKHSSGPRVSDILARSLGIRGQIFKTRHCFNLGEALICIDCIDELGNFIKVKIDSSPDKNQAGRRGIAMDIMKNVGVLEETFLSGTYIDLLLHGNA